MHKKLKNEKIVKDLMRNSSRFAESEQSCTSEIEGCIAFGNIIFLGECKRHFGELKVSLKPKKMT